MTNYNTHHILQSLSDDILLFAFFVHPVFYPFHSPLVVNFLGSSTMTFSELWAKHRHLTVNVALLHALKKKPTYIYITANHKKKL